MKRRAQPWLGTMVEIAVDDARDHAALTVAFDAAFAQIALVHRLMSFHDPASDISRINQAEPGTTVTVHPHTSRVLRLALELCERSGGAFNIACAPRLVAWGQLPAAGMPVPAYDPRQPVIRVEPSGAVAKLAPGWIDAGGIAKGYAVDLAVDALRLAGAAGGCVNAGGDLRAFGPRPFPVGVRDPRDPGRLAVQLELADEALATSAPYFSLKARDMEATSALCNGLIGAAIVDPVSVSVRSPACVTADALTKVVLSTRDTTHPALAAYCATSFLI